LGFDEQRNEDSFQQEYKALKNTKEFRMLCSAKKTNIENIRDLMIKVKKLKENTRKLCSEYNEAIEYESE